MIIKKSENQLLQESLDQRYLEISEAMNFYTQEARQARFMYYLIIHYRMGTPLSLIFDKDVNGYLNKNEVRKLFRTLLKMNDDQIFELSQYYLDKSLDYLEAIEAYVGDF